MMQPHGALGHRLSPHLPLWHLPQPSRRPWRPSTAQCRAGRRPETQPGGFTGTRKGLPVSGAGPGARSALPVDTDRVQSHGSASTSGRAAPAFRDSSRSGDGDGGSMGYRGSGRGSGPPTYEMLQQQDFGKFVSFFRGASPYIEGHRGRTFVIVIPGEVICREELLYPLLEDVALLSGAWLVAWPPTSN